MADISDDSTSVDLIDRAIIGTLQRRGRISWRELGDEVGLGATATADRVRRLEHNGVITGYTAVIDPTSMGIGINAVVELKLDPDTDDIVFEAMLAATPEVSRASHVTGVYDYVLTLACGDVSALDRILRDWKHEHGVLESSTRIILAEIDLTA